MADPCVFCDKIATRDYEDGTEDVVWFEPLNPVAPGHMLFVPREHVRSAKSSPRLAGLAAAEAADYGRAYRAFNIITSAEAEATQTVWHLHVHLVPRRDHDGLTLPWTGQGEAGR